MYKRYEMYKDSEVEWIGEIPEHWKYVQIKHLTRVKRGASPRPIDDPVYFDDGGCYSWVRISDVTKSRDYLTETTQRMSEIGANLSVKLKPDSLFISICATVGKPCITKIDCCIHDGFVYFPDFNGDQKFLFYVFKSEEPYKGLGKLGTQLNLNTDAIGSIYIAYPAFEEQVVIRKFLDHKTSEIDSLIADKEELIKKLEEYKQSIITEAVTKGLNPDVKMKDSQIKHLTRVKRGASPRPIDDPKYFDSEGRYSWVRISDVTSAGDYLEKTTQKLSAFGANLSVKLNPGTLFISICATVGKPCITNIDCCIHDGFVYFPDYKGDYKFVFYIFKSGEPYKGLGKFGTQLNLNTDTIGSIFIPCPPKEEQMNIRDFLDVKTLEIDLLIEDIQESVNNLIEYRQSLIYEAITGKIKTIN